MVSSSQYFAIFDSAGNRIDGSIFREVHSALNWADSDANEFIDIVHPEVIWTFSFSNDAYVLFDSFPAVYEFAYNEVADLHPDFDEDQINARIERGIRLIINN